MIRPLCVLAAVLLILQVKAQQSFNDSMLQAYRDEKFEANKLKTISFLVAEGKADLAKKILLNGLRESRREDTARISMLYSLSTLVVDKDADSSLLLVQQALTISEKLKFTRGEAEQIANSLTSE